LNLPINQFKEEAERLTVLTPVAEATSLTLNQLIQTQAGYSVDEENM
jgi:hypothetical protein